jgi:hypothetical protein
VKAHKKKLPKEAPGGRDVPDIGRDLQPLGDAMAATLRTLKGAMVDPAQAMIFAALPRV